MVIQDSQGTCQGQVSTRQPLSDPWGMCQAPYAVRASMCRLLIWKNEGYHS